MFVLDHVEQPRFREPSSSFLEDDDGPVGYSRHEQLKRELNSSDMELGERGAGSSSLREARYIHIDIYMRI